MPPTNIRTLDELNTHLNQMQADIDQLPGSEVVDQLASKIKSIMSIVTSGLGKEGGANPLEPGGSFNIIHGRGDPDAMTRFGVAVALNAKRAGMFPDAALVKAEEVKAALGTSLTQIGVPMLATA